MATKKEVLAALESYEDEVGLVSGIDPVAAIKLVAELLLMIATGKPIWDIVMFIIQAIKALRG